MSEYRRILDARSLSANQVQDKEEVWDAGAYLTLEPQFRVLKAGTAGTLHVQHAAVNEEDAFVNLPSASILLNVAGSAEVGITSFLRYVRWFSDGLVAGGPVCIIDGIAKGT